MSRAAAPSRQPSSSRGGWLAHQERGSPAALRGSEADPTGFHLDAGARPIQLGSTWMQLTKLLKTTLAQPAWPRSAVGTATLSLAVKDQGWE